MVDPSELDANELVSVRLSSDRQRLRLRLRDQLGRMLSLSLPASWLNTIQSAVPQHVESGTIHPLDSWSIVPAENSQDLVLTLRTPQGQAVSFTAKSWQFEGMATIATYGKPGAAPAKTVH